VRNNFESEKNIGLSTVKAESGYFVLENQSLLKFNDKLQMIYKQSLVNIGRVILCEMDYPSDLLIMLNGQQKRLLFYNV